MRVQNRALSVDIWTLISVVIGCVVLIPVLVVVSNIARDSGGIWGHLVETRMSDYVGNTLYLSLGVCMVVTVVSLPTAWLVTRYDFPGRSILDWALMLPLAIPSYIAAYGLTDLFQFSGPVQTWIRETMGWQAGDYWFPELRSLNGAVIILSFTLYPYLYFAARTAFMEQSRTLFDVSRTLGNGPIHTFFRVVLPLARPSLVGGLMLVVMETLADFGTVDYCAVDTFATGIYRTWYSLDSPVGASQLSVVLLALIAFIIVCEAISRRKAQYHSQLRRHQEAGRTRLNGSLAWCATLACTLPVMVGFILPTARLALLALNHQNPTSVSLVTHALNTTYVSLAAALITLSCALLVVYTARRKPHALPIGNVYVCRAGYALPGPVIAIGLLIAFSSLDHFINSIYVWLANDTAPLMLLSVSSSAAVILGYQTRFLAVPIAMVESAFARIPGRIDDAARLLGASAMRTLVKVHIPNLRATLAAAFLVVFVDVAKELPITMMLRPFNFDTLAVRTYQLASDERLDEAASSALSIIAVGILPIIIVPALTRSTPKSTGQVAS